MKYTLYTLSSTAKIEDIKYVGVTIRRINQRLSQHIYNAKQNKITPVSKWIYSKLLLNEKIIITELETVTEKYWEEAEKFWIEQMKSWGFKLLNVDIGGKGVVLKKRRDISGILRSIEAHKIKIIKLDMQLNVISYYNSITEAKIEGKYKSMSSITNVLDKPNKYSKGFIWLTEKTFLDKKLLSIYLPKPSKFHLGQICYQYDVNTQILIQKHYSLRKVFDKLQVKPSSGLKIAIKNKTSWKKFYWSYEKITNFDEYKPNNFTVFEKTPDGTTLNVFYNVTEVSKDLKKCKTYVHHIINNKIMTKRNTFLTYNKL